MKPLKPVVILIAIFVFFETHRAFALELETSVTEKNSNLSVLGMTSSFATSEGAIGGNGIGIDFSRYFSKRSSLELSLITSLSGGKGVSNATTGFGGFYYYNLFSDCCDKTKKVMVGGLPVISETYRQPSVVFQLGLGVNQFFLNGSRGVYSLSGLGLGGNLYWLFKGYNIKITARFSKMKSNEIEVKGTFLGVGLQFPL